MLCAFLPALAGMGAACCPDTFYELLAPAPTVRLPEDEEPHCSGGEWWYYTGNVYWEGLCEVAGTHAGQQVTGSAFVELTNYP